MEKFGSHGRIGNCTLGSMSVSLSRHLYRMDEVKASLRQSILKRRRLDAVFWAMELLDSMDGMSILEILVDCWLNSAPFVSTLGNAVLDLLGKDELDPDEILQLVHAAAAVGERDCSVFWLLSQGCLDWKQQPDFVGAVELPAMYASVLPEIQCFVRALLQGKALLAFTLVRASWSADTWQILQSCASVKGLNKESMKLLGRLAAADIPERFLWESRALGLLMVALRKNSKQCALKTEIGAEILEKKREWESIEGRRARRALRIPSDAILWGCQRSLQKNTETNIGELREPFQALKGSPYWETVAVDMGGWRRITKSDDHKEVFYDLYFPDDIPDEWSVADQEKSHGYGALIGSLTADGQYCKYLRSAYLGCASNGLQSLTKKAAEISAGRDGWNKVYEEKRVVWEEIQKGWRLTPVKKKILVLQ
jgi:hypothetical protein